MTFVRTLASAAALLVTATALHAAGRTRGHLRPRRQVRQDPSTRASFDGAEQFKKETGIEYREFELQTDAQREQALRRFARARAFDPIVAVGFSPGDAR